VVDEGGQDAAVEIAKRREELLADLELGSQPPRPGVDQPDAQPTRQATGPLVRLHQTTCHILVVALELWDWLDHVASSRTSSPAPAAGGRYVTPIGRTRVDEMDQTPT
jgi:hypothetical protein